MGLEFLQDEPEPAFIVRQRLVQQFPAGPVQGVMVALADVQANKHINSFVVFDHVAPPVAAARRVRACRWCRSPAFTLRTAIRSALPLLAVSPAPAGPGGFTP
ncbi:hypothetical protein [Arthrobacter sp. UYCu712]|uniref:hypothetical protein n=1 Tax=Arthrobacter sp. UYCu712 TaxID=3156340 RepID=UPI003397039C